MWRGENCEDWSLVRHALLASIQPLVLLLLLSDVRHHSNATFIRRNSLVGEMAVTAPSNKMSHTALHYSLRLDVSKPHYRLIRLSPQLPLLLPFIVISNQVWSVTILFSTKCPWPGGPLTNDSLKIQSIKYFRNFSIYFDPLKLQAGWNEIARMFCLRGVDLVWTQLLGPFWLPPLSKP